MIEMQNVHPRTITGQLLKKMRHVKLNWGNWKVMQLRRNVKPVEIPRISKEIHLKL